jgi:tetratricopeptide (TPR) repeat protein
MFEKDLAIAEHLAEKDPANALWQEDLRNTYNAIGGVLKTQGDLAGALEMYEKDLAIAERLAEQRVQAARNQSEAKKPVPAAPPARLRAPRLACLASRLRRRPRSPLPAALSSPVCGRT